MIQSINSHVRRLIYDKNQCETDFKKAKDLMKNKAQTILSQCKYVNDNVMFH